MMTATKVVARKNRMVSVLRRPKPASRSPPAMPRMTDATTNGTTTNWIATKNSRPGRASQLPMRREVRESTQPTPGPSSSPTTIPRPMPIRTCSH